MNLPSAETIVELVNAIPSRTDQIAAVDKYKCEILEAAANRIAKARTKAEGQRMIRAMKEEL